MCHEDEAVACTQEEPAPTGGHAYLDYDADRTRTVDDCV